MLFHSLEYSIFLFVVVTLFWFLTKLKLWRLFFLLSASYFFYAYWNPYYLLLIWYTSTVDFFVGLKISSCKDSDKNRRKRFLLISIISNLTILAVFKYFNFFSASIIEFASLFNYKLETIQLNLLLPVGISFYTFQSLSYVIDVYRGKQEATKNYILYLLFISFFPQLVAGPIVRSSVLMPQLLNTPKLNSIQGSEGLYLIIRGLIKKVAIADLLGLELVDRVFDFPERFSSLELIIAMYAYTLQIYCDFSGYTDIARGSSKLLGIELPENFNLPYLSTSIREFWRRWHITLSTWLRDYLYISLGGSKKGKIRTYINLMVTMLLGGLWHGASWTFVIWGGIHGVLLILTRIWEESGVNRAFLKLFQPRSFIYKIVTWFFCFHAVAILWLLFRSDTFSQFLKILRLIFEMDIYIVNIPWTVWLALILGYSGHYFPRRFWERIEQGFIGLPSPVMGSIIAISLLVLYKIIGLNPSPFIYFQF